MRKRQKQILGCVGLAVVVGMTCLAIAMPERGASATNNVVDTINVRVISAMPDVEINGIVDDGYYANIERYFTVSYENIDTLIVNLDYTNLDGNTISKEIEHTPIEDVSGVKDYNIRLIK